MSISTLEWPTGYDSQKEEDRSKVADLLKDEWLREPEEKIKKHDNPVSKLVKDLRQQLDMEDTGRQTDSIIKDTYSQSKPANFDLLEPQQASEQKTLYKKNEPIDSKRVELSQITADQKEKDTAKKAQELTNELPQIENDFLQAIYEHVEQKEQSWVLEKGKELKKLWHKGWLARLGVGGALTVMGIVNPGFLLAKLGWRIATASVGNTLGAEAIWSKMEAARFTRREGKTWQSYQEAGKTFLHTLWEKKSLKYKEGFGLGQAFGASREKLVEVGHISSKEELNRQLEMMNDQEKLAEIKRRIAGIAEIARRRDIESKKKSGDGNSDQKKSIEELLGETIGAQKSTEILLNAYKELRESVQTKSADEMIKKYSEEIEDPNVTLEQFKTKVIAELTEKEQIEWQELLSLAVKDENKRAIKRWVGSAAIGVVTGLLTLGLAKGFGLGVHKEAVGAAAVAGAASKEVTKEKIATFIQDAAQQGELRTTIPNSFYGPNIPVVEHNGHLFAQIDGKEYPYLVENSQKLIVVHADIDHDGLPDANSTVKINLDNGFGQFTDQAGQKHLMQALDLYKEGINSNADAIIARDGAILHDASGKMINGQIWQEKDGYHASVLGKVDVGTKINPEGIVFDQDTNSKLPHEELKKLVESNNFDAKEFEQAKAIYGNTYEVEYLSGTPEEVAEQFKLLTHQMSLKSELIVKFITDNHINPSKTDFGALEQFTNNLGFERLESGVNFSEACKTYIRENIINKLGTRLISGRDKLNLVELFKGNKAIMDSPVLNPLFSGANTDHLSMWYDKSKETLYLIDTQKDAYDMTGNGGVYPFPKQALDLIKPMDTKHILDKVLNK